MCLDLDARKSLLGCALSPSGWGIPFDARVLAGRFVPFGFNKSCTLPRVRVFSEVPFGLSLDLTHVCLRSLSIAEPSQDDSCR